MQIRFERGTLVCEPEGERDELSTLPGTVWDDEARAWRVAAGRYAELARWLTMRRVRFSDKLPDWRLAVRWPMPALQAWQAAALDRWRVAELRGVIAMPSGPMARLVALAAITRLGVATLCLVPDLRVLEAWREMLAAATGLSVGKLGDGLPQVAAVTVATYAGAAVWAPQLGDRYGLAIVDEAHRVGAGCPPEILELLVAPARLGLAAMPPEAPTVLERSGGPVLSGRAAELPAPSAPEVPRMPEGTPVPEVTRVPEATRVPEWTRVPEVPRGMGAVPIAQAVDRALRTLIGDAGLTPVAGGAS